MRTVLPNRCSRDLVDIRASRKVNKETSWLIPENWLTLRLSQGLRRWRGGRHGVSRSRWENYGVRGFVLRAENYGEAAQAASVRRVVIAVRPALGIVSQAVEQILNALRRVSGLSHEASPKPISYFFADCGVVGCIEVAGISVRHSTSSTRNLPMTPRERLGIVPEAKYKSELNSCGRSGQLGQEIESDYVASWVWNEAAKHYC